jgi:hypothetical protein
MSKDSSISLSRDFSRALSPLAFAADCGIETLDPWQVDVLTSDSIRMLLCTGRQMGKSTICALLALHLLLYTPGSTVILISPSLNQSVELYRRLHTFYEKLSGVPLAQQESLTRMTLDNGSRALSLPSSEKTIRGLTADLIIVDEAARVEDSLFSAVSPMIATKADGRMILLTTPAGRRGHFFNEWHSGNGWKKISVTASQCPRISQAYLDDMLRTLGPLRFAAEFNAEFHDDSISTFGADLIRKAFEHDNFEPIRI